MATRTLWAITHTKPASRWNLVPNGMMIHHQPLVHLRMRGYIELPRDSPTLKSNNSTSSAQTGKTNQIQNNQANANASAGGTGADATNPPMAQEMKRILVKNLMDLWNTFKNGSLLFWKETKEAAVLRDKLRKDSTLRPNRQEARLLQRNASDWKKIVPFMILFWTPGSALTLPVLTWIFPGLIPSTYFSEADKVKDRAKLRDQRAHLAQIIINDIIRNHQNDPSASKILQLGISGDTNILEDKVFQEWVDRYVQLEMLPTVPIKSLAKFYGFISWKPASWLRNDLAKWYYQLQKDDKMIHDEGASSLTQEQLEEALSERGIDTKTSISDPVKALSGWVAHSQEWGTSFYLLAPSFMHLSDNEAQQQTNTQKQANQAIPSQPHQGTEHK